MSRSRRMTLLQARGTRYHFPKSAWHQNTNWVFDDNIGPPDFAGFRTRMAHFRPTQRKYLFKQKELSRIPDAQRCCRVAL